MKNANLLLGFLLELAMLGAWAWFGLSLALPAPWPTLVAILVPLLVIALWGLFAAPRARFPLSVPATVAVKAALLGGGAVALAAVEPLWGAVDAVLVAFNLVLALVWGQFAPLAPTTALKNRLATLVDDYARRWSEPTVGRFREFLASGEVLQGKANPRRHITASAWIVNPGRTKVLLTHHAKLNIWVQLGGHTDEGEDWAEAALREAREESGLAHLRLVQPGLFDLDIHTIPARNSGGQTTASHEHYDLRFLVEADDAQPLVISDESHALAWVPLDRLEEYTTETSQLRMRLKTPKRTFASSPSP